VLTGVYSRYRASRIPIVPEVQAARIAASDTRSTNAVFPNDIEPKIALILALILALTPLHYHARGYGLSFRMRRMQIQLTFARAMMTGMQG